MIHFMCIAVETYTVAKFLSPFVHAQDSIQISQCSLTWCKSCRLRQRLQLYRPKWPGKMKKDTWLLCSVALGQRVLTHDSRQVHSFSGQLAVDISKMFPMSCSNTWIVQWPSMIRNGPRDSWQRIH